MGDDGEVVADHQEGQLAVAAAPASSRLSTSACTEASSADVGSSSSRIDGSRISARAIATRWRWPPDKLMRIAEAEAGAEADLVERPQDALFAIGEAVDGERLQQQPVDGLARMQRAVRVLEDHLHFAVEGLVAMRAKLSCR